MSGYPIFAAKLVTTITLGIIATWYCKIINLEKVWKKLQHNNDIISKSLFYKDFYED